MNWIRKSRYAGVTETHLYQRHLKSCKGGSGCRCPWWIRGYIQGEKIRESLQTNRMDVALDRQKQREKGSIADPAPLPAPAPPPAAPPAETQYSLATLIDKYIAHRVAYASIVDSTQTEYSICLRKFREYMERRGVRTLEQLTPELVEDYLVQGKYKPRTRFKHYRHLVGLFKYAAKRARISLSLLPEHPPRVPKEGAHRPLSATEQHRILNGCERAQMRYRARDRAIFLTLICTGLRSVDVRQLRWPNFDFSRRELRVRMQKTRAHRAYDLVIPNLPAVLLEALRALPRSTDLAQPIFTSAEGACTSATWRSIMKGIFKHGGVEATAHDCRVTFAVERLAGGAQIWDVSQLLGHSSTAITERYYIKWVKGLDQRLAEVMGRADFSHLERTGS